jgi:Zn-dependent M28 family amino/carboxypeptidase
VSPTDPPDVPAPVSSGAVSPPAAHRHGGCRTGHRPSGAVAAAAPVTERLVQDPDVVALLGTLSREAFLADLATITAHRTRLSSSAGFDDVATWAAAELERVGYAVSTQAVPRGGGRCRNVIADRPGADPEPRDVVLVTAHLDSINLSEGPENPPGGAGTQGGGLSTLSDAAGPAPGADDNASGSAGLLALSRALADRPTALDLRLILFGGEEQGLFGSLAYVAELPDVERTRIRAVLNMDMIGGRNTPGPGVLLEGAEVSQDVLDALARAAAAYTGLAVSTSLRPFNSDHVPFIDAGIPAVLTIEADDSANTRPHTADDTVDAVDPDLAIEILRMNLAYLVEALGQACGR